MSTNKDHTTHMLQLQYFNKNSIKMYKLWTENLNNKDNKYKQYTIKHVVHHI